MGTSGSGSSSDDDQQTIEDGAGDDGGGDNSDVGDVDSGTETETDAGTGTETDTATGTETDTDTDTDTGTDTDSETDTDTDTGTDAFTLTSADFDNGGEIPQIHACTYYGGSDVSPQLSWENAPENTDSYAILMDDEDAPCGTGDDACTHWMVYNIPSSVTNFTQGETVTNISGVTEGMTIGYVGPCPPNMHTYKITIYALKDTMPAVESGTVLTRSEFTTTYGAHILDSVTLQGTYTP